MLANSGRVTVAHFNTGLTSTRTTLKVGPSLCVDLVIADRNYYEGDLETDKSAQDIKVAAIYFCVVMNFPTLPFFIFGHWI